MRKRAILGLVAFVVLGFGGISLAKSSYSWVQVVERGIPNFNNGEVAQEALLATTPLRLSFPSGVHVLFVFVRHEGHTYAVYHDQETSGVAGIARLDWDPAYPQELHFYEFYVDTGLLKGHALTGRFLYFARSDRIFAGLCQIADLSHEARPHAQCPRTT